MIRTYLSLKNVLKYRGPSKKSNIRTELVWQFQCDEFNVKVSAAPLKDLYQQLQQKLP